MYLMSVYLIGMHLTGMYLIGIYGLASHGRVSPTRGTVDSRAFPSLSLPLDSNIQQRSHRSDLIKTAARL